MEHYLEARLWNDIFRMSQDYIGIPRGSIRATVLIETITAAFQMDEIIYELREHSSGLNCGRWDYIFSFIKKMRMHPDFVLPDRSHVTMTVPFMSSYVQLLIKTCHKRGVAAIGGMAAQIPIKNDEAKNNAVMDKVRAEKTPREGTGPPPKSSASATPATTARGSRTRAWSRLRWTSSTRACPDRTSTTSVARTST